MYKSYSASLRIFSRTKTAREVMDVLQTRATESHDVGERYSVRNPKSRIFDRSVCIFRSKLSSDTFLEDHLLEVAKFVEDKEPQIRLLMNECEIDVMCMASSDNGQGTFTLEHSIAAKFVAMDLDITFDIYLTD